MTTQYSFREMVTSALAANVCSLTTLFLRHCKAGERGETRLFKYFNILDGEPSVRRLSPGGSVKDQSVSRMLREEVIGGALLPEKTILDSPTKSTNTEILARTVR